MTQIIQPHYDGPALVKIDAYQGTGLESLGYTEEGVDVSHRKFFLDVHGDQNGGSDGPPIDIQFLGEIAVVSLRLTTYDSAIADKILRSVAYSSTTGRHASPGTLMLTDLGGTGSANPAYFRLLISPTNDPFNFPIAMIRDPHEQNKSTKHKKFIATFTCYKNPSTQVLWNQVTS